MKTLALFLLSVPLWALSNAVTITDISGTNQANRVIMIPRYFAQGEICQYPQPFTGGSPIAFWQANVRNRWPADANCGTGYVKFAVITIEQTIHGSVVVEFRNSSASSSGGAGVTTQSQILNFNTGAGAGSWGSKITATTGGITFSRSARTMIGAGQWSMIESGPLMTHIMVREGPDDQNGDLTRTTSFGWQCISSKVSGAEVACIEPYGAYTWNQADGSILAGGFTVTAGSPNVATFSIRNWPTNYTMPAGMSVTVAGATTAGLNGPHTISASTTGPPVSFQTTAAPGTYPEGAVTITRGAASWTSTGTDCPSGTDCHYGIRPSFEIYFFTSPTGGVANNTVRVTPILDNGWMDRGQDQRLESYALYQGGSESTPCYTAPAAFVLTHKSREASNDCWSTAPPTTQIDFNRPYVTYTKVLPNYDLSYIVGQSAIQLELGEFAQSDGGATTTVTTPTYQGFPGYHAPAMGYAQWSGEGGSTGGSEPNLGWTPRWNARYVATYDYRLYNVMVANARARMHGVFYFWESTTTANPTSGLTVFTPGNSAKAFGRLVSLDVRQSWSQTIGVLPGDKILAPNGTPLNNQAGNGTCMDWAACMVTCATLSSATIGWCGGPNSVAIPAIGNWGQDTAHADGAFIVPYLFTGDYIYLESQYAMADWLISNTVMDDPPVNRYSHRGSNGLIYDQWNAIRSTAWGLRNLAGAVLMAPDGSAEQLYFNNKLNNNLQSNEGRFNITNGFFPPPNNNPTCPNWNPGAPDGIHAVNPAAIAAANQLGNWCMGRLWAEKGRSNPTAVSILHDPDSAWDNVSWGASGNLAGDSLSPWMDIGYWSTMLAWLRDIGFKSDYVHNLAAIQAIHATADTVFSQGPGSIATYLWPVALPGKTGYIQSWTARAQAYLRTVPLAQALNSSATTIFLDSDCQSVNNFDTCNNYIGGTYFKIDNEAVQLQSYSLSQQNVTAVNTSTSRVTIPNHGYPNGSLVEFQGGKLDNGMLPNSNCRTYWLPTDNNNFAECTFYVKVIDTNTLELYNDAALASKVTLTGGSSGLMSTLSVWVVTRGALGTTPAAHNVGATVTYLPIIFPAAQNGDPTGAHSYLFLAGLAGAVDYDLTTTDEGTGRILTARRAFDLMDQWVYWQQYAGANVADCTAAGLNISRCDNPQWGIRPRPLIRNVRTVTPGGGSATLYYTAPDGNGCKIGISSSAFTSTDDSSDTADGLKNLGRFFTKTGLTSGASYYYRITCGPAGGAARVSGIFTVQ